MLSVAPVRPHSCTAFVGGLFYREFCEPRSGGLEFGGFLFLVVSWAAVSLNVPSLLSLQTSVGEVLTSYGRAEGLREVERLVAQGRREVLSVSLCFSLSRALLLCVSFSPLPLLYLFQSLLVVWFIPGCLPPVRRKEAVD